MGVSLLPLIIMLLIAKSKTIDQDYYLNIEEFEKSDIFNLNNNTTIARRADNTARKSKENLITDSVLKFAKGISKSFARDDDNLEDPTDDDTTKTIGYSSTEDNKIKELDRNFKSFVGKDNSSSDKGFSSTTLSLSNLLHKDYEYIYDDEEVTTPRRAQLRTKKRNKTHPNRSKTSRIPGSFYNIEPVAGKIYFNNDSSTSFDNDNTWYVQEKYPCWELPLLYGELSPKKKSLEVFITFERKLINVVESGIKEEIPPKMLQTPSGRILNKWCAAEPCYGDHTLCIFSDKRVAKICFDGYTVRGPSMMEQIALVNTVNSMRNHVANGDADRYPHLPPAANMKQIIYDYDLEKMAKAWLHQCLPGPAPCSALDGHYVTQLECTKYAKSCCLNLPNFQKGPKCIPKYECFVRPIIGCIHSWYWSAGNTLTKTDVDCGYSTVSTFNTVQLLWANTNKIGCAYGERQNGDVRVVCNFAPGAPFYIDTKYFCGLIDHKYVKQTMTEKKNIMDIDVLASIGISFKMVPPPENVTPYVYSESKIKTEMLKSSDDSSRLSNLEILKSIYKDGWIREKCNNYTNGTHGMVARLVTRYSFYENTQSRCDSDEPIYKSGEPGSLCVEKGRRFHALCYDFRDPTPGYRLVAVLAPVALFSLILYDLFSGVVRQTNY